MNIKSTLQTIRLNLAVLYVAAVFIYSVCVLGKLAFDWIVVGCQTLVRKFSRKS